ncbi:RTA1-domain-containing protein [Meredithblackwellia eburnea MCA 4105]
MAKTDNWHYYAYNPSKTMPIVTAVLFGACFFVLLFQMFRTRSWYMWAFTLAALGECTGYIFRRISVDHPTGRGAALIWFILQSLWIILAPALMAASHYMCFGRLITYVGEKYSPVRAKKVTWIFVVFDVISFVVQGGGGSLYSSDNVKLYKPAKAILVCGFLIQIISFGIFGVFAILYQIRARRAGEKEGKWTVCLYTLYLGCALILVRGIFRTIEFGSGSGGHGYLLDREAWYYGLETLPIFVCTILFIISHPSRYIPSDRSARLHPELELSTRGGSGISLEEAKDVETEEVRRKWWNFGRK